MKKVAFLLLCLAFAVSANVRTNDGPSSSESALVKGTYTLLESYQVDLVGFGVAVKDDVANSIWIDDYGVAFTYEFDMTNGDPTGDGWEITNGIDCDDMAYCEYTGGNQFLIGDWIESKVGVFSADGIYVKDIEGPGAWDNVFGMGAGHDMLYCSKSGEIAWGSYTGSETEVTWTIEAMPYSIYGLAVHGDYLFVCSNIEDADNIFIYYINADGSVNLTPLWSCYFTENGGSTNGGLDWDGTYLWVYPQQDMLYKLDIDWVPGSLENSTWGEIKADF
ncbi:MAG: hypothetical protein K8R76_01220 [Candidatus Aegiribacteria sp.]|nr:hypothetical protein [Candidatus Aegiribacteria sp.]